MSGYEVEHNITAEAKPETTRRPDLSTFFSTLREVDTSDESQRNNAHSLPLPENVTAVFRLLAEAIQAMSGDAESEGTELQQSMIEQLLRNAHDPPREVAGVPESFFDDLDRVPKAKLRKDEDCPICGQPFLDGVFGNDGSVAGVEELMNLAIDPYPLVVRLPCHSDHKFDLECIRPWLKINTTCPLDRKQLIKAKSPPPPDSEDEEDYDGFYA